MGSTDNPRKGTSLQTQGDHNTPHATLEAGETHGFGGGIIHGLFSWNVTTHIVLWYHVHQNELRVRIFSSVKPSNKLEMSLSEIDAIRNTSQDSDLDTMRRYIVKRFIVKVEATAILSDGRALWKCSQRSLVI